MKPRLTVIVLTGVLLAWFFAPAVGGKSSFAFRDAAHYFHPLYQYVRGEWLAGRPPLWNPYENIGVPLVAQNTSGVFYPGQLLFLLPLDYTFLYNAYVVLHVVLAAVGGYALARHLGATHLGAGLGALSYAFCGNVLFGYCNVVFLVGAAWLPVAMLLADRMLRQRRVGSALGLGVVLALVILGGDPQMAYNGVLLVGLLAWLSWREERRVSPPAADSETKNSVMRRPALMAVALSIAGLLAAVQILPTLEASPHSPRAKYDAPRNVYELARSLTVRDGDAGLAWYDGLLGRVAGGHERQVYQFSVAPWRAVELVWPNVTGGAFPTNRRWLGALGMESSPWDLWTPTLYMGLLPLVLAAAAWNVRRGAPLAVRFLSWMVVCGALASLGVYGIGWAVGAERFDIGGEVGGPYWWLNVLLPKYVYFRYPAKWFVVASLGLSMLAARGWDQAWQTDSHRVRRWFVVIAAASLAGLVVTAAGWSRVERLGAMSSPTPILGPLDWAGAHRDVLTALGQTAALSAVFVGAFYLAGRRPPWAAATRVAVLAVVALDLAAAQGRLMMYAPAEYWQESPQILDALPEKPAGYRVFRQPGPRDPSWERSFSTQRLAECVRWDRQTLVPKYPLPLGVSLAEASETLTSDDYRALLHVARSHNRRVHKSPLPDASILDLLAAKVALVDADADADSDARAEMASTERVAEGMFLGVRPRALDRAWIVHRVEVLGEFESLSPRRLKERTEAVLFPGGNPRDWRNVAVVETEDAIALPPEPLDHPAGESCTVVYADPLVVEIEAKLVAAGLVVLGDLDYPGWELTVESEAGVGRPVAARGQAAEGQATRRVPILRTNRVMRGALLPAGSHRLTYRYRPQSVLYGGAISGLSLVALLVAAIVARFRRR